ncbi:EF-P beta-lysylation protein EpmB [Marinobacter sp. chi1]|uniref:L-lysine 2,3-aminomutase n=1 Tax=Marinobacter suaedae TaxID=3057675 RepID=A0ABT8VWS1_9GAMM|nr:EF-P beta-lysylation protein EpmB [Marinobacter sp. chi1]MDO3720437.1 EF-P beta-lysylation protein EpmB [Marinobacter sp. chi1]
MIQRTPTRIEAHPAEDRRTWQQLLSNSITSPADLLERLELAPETWLEGAKTGHRLFAVRVPEPFLARMRKGDPYDPLLRQVLPLTDETEPADGFVQDPLAENGAIQTTGLIRKYRSRALLMVTGQCAINCRYCFRRHFPYEDQRLSPSDRQKVIETLGDSPEINEVIFSGGDPLVASDRLLADWADAITGLPHIRRLRLHTRLPVVIPQRVCDALIDWISQTSVRVVMVLHINHPAEIDASVREALARLSEVGVTLLNQSVILRGINDSADTLESLSESLFDAGVLPYYLHAFDPVRGAHHFDVEDQRAQGLIQQLLTRLPGFLVPRLVREIPGEESKTPLNINL